MQLLLTFLCSALLLPALATAATNSTVIKGNSTITHVSSTFTSFPTLTPTHSFPNGTNGNSTRSITSTKKKNFTATTTASESLSTTTNLVVETGSSTTGSGAAATTTASSSQAAGDAVKKVGNSVGAFAIAMGVLFVGHLL